MLREECGEQVVGFKVGCTSPILQKNFGISQPDSEIDLFTISVPSNITDVSIEQLQKVTTKISHGLYASVTPAVVSAKETLDSASPFIGPARFSARLESG